MAVYDVVWSAPVSGVANGTVGYAVGLINGGYVVATAANIAAGAIPGYVVITIPDPNGVCELQVSGTINAAISNLGAGVEAPVVIASDGRLARKASPVYGADWIVGDCDAQGNVVLSWGISHISPPAGTVPTGTGFVHITAGAQDAAARAVNLATADVTGLLPVGNIAPSATNGQVLTTVGGVTAWAAGFTAGGDLSGTSTSQTVVGLQGRAVAATAPNTGNTLGWNGTAWAPSALNLAGGANYVTGTLPAGNLPNLAGDVTGPVSATVVGAISGTSPIAITPNTLQWINTATAPTLTQATTTNATGYTLSIIGQQAATTGGALYVAGGSASSTFGAFQIGFGPSLVAVTFQRASAGLDTTIAVAADSAGTGANAFNLKQNTTTRATASNTTHTAQSSSNASGVGGNWIVTPGAGSSATNAGYVQVTDQANVVQMQWSNEGTVVPSGRPHLFLSHASFQPIGSRGATATGTSGYLNFGNDASGVFMAHVLSNNVSYKVISRNNDFIAFGDPAQYTTLYGLNINITDNSLWTIGGSNSTGNTYINSAYHYFAGTNGVEALRFTVTSAGACTEQYAIGVTSITIKQADQTANGAGGASLNIQAQNCTGTTSTGGSVNVTSGTGTTTAGFVNLQTGGTTKVSVQPNGLQVGSGTAAFGGGVGVIGITDSTTQPTANPTGGGVLYSASGALWWRGSGGTVTKIANA